MKACKLCDLLEHQQQKLTDKTFDGLSTATVVTTTAATQPSANNSATIENRLSAKNFCKHKLSNSNGGAGDDSSTTTSELSTKNSPSSLSLPSSFSMLSPYLKDMFLAAHLIRGKIFPN